MNNRSLIPTALTRLTAGLLLLTSVWFISGCSGHNHNSLSKNNLPKVTTPYQTSPVPSRYQPPLVPSPPAVAGDPQSRFTHAGPLQPVVDVERMVLARRPCGIYRVVPGDILELSMPAILRVVNADLTDIIGQVEPYQCRVNEEGTIIVPIIGEIPVVGKSPAEIEQQVIDAYYPKYVVNPPSVVARVVSYRTAKISVVGAVKKPGLYDCSSDEMSLVAVLMKAGGIVDHGAAIIRIHRTGQTYPYALPVKGLNIPFTDVSLSDGDMVEIEHLPEQVFTVIGLVNRPGVFPYVPGNRYSLLQSLAYAGGVNDIADPSYVKIYRQDSSGNILVATFQIKGDALTTTSNVTIKPGDVVSVEQTFATRSRLLLANVLRITTGVSMIYHIDETDLSDD